MVEATEELVKIFLEQKGYMVTTSKRVEAFTSKYSPRAELDIIAIKPKEDDSEKLPPRIIGEVKSFPIDQRGFENLDKKLREKYGYKSRQEYARYKWINNVDYRNEILEKVKEEYGYDDFKFVLFCSGIKSKYEEEIKEYLQEENIELVTHQTVLQWLFENRSNEYTDNQIMQVIRLIKQNAKVIF